jgi:hypothetical protein
MANDFINHIKCNEASVKPQKNWVQIASSLLDKEGSGGWSVREGRKLCTPPLALP